jgi:hypothetical protein
MAQGRAFYRQGDLGSAFSAFNALLSLLCFRGEIIRALDSDLVIEGAWRDIEQAWLLASSIAALGISIY